MIDKTWIVDLDDSSHLQVRRKCPGDLEVCAIFQSNVNNVLFVEMANMSLVGKVNRGARYLLVLLVAPLPMKNGWQRKLKLNGKSRNLC